MNDNDDLNDSAVLTAVRDSMSGVPMATAPRPEAIMARARARRRRRLSGLSIAGAGACAALVVGPHLRIDHDERLPVPCTRLLPWIRPQRRSVRDASSRRERSSTVRCETEPKIGDAPGKPVTVSNLRLWAPAHTIADYGALQRLPRRQLTSGQAPGAKVRLRTSPAISCAAPATNQVELVGST